MRILFAGTPQFAVPSLLALCDSPHQVVGLLSRPDRPKGRSGKPVWTETKKVAVSREIPVFQPHKLKTSEFERAIKNLSPDLIAVTAYGEIFPLSMLKIPPLGCINVHASLLPRYRGAAPINWAIASGEKETGVSIMLMNEGMDTGDVLAQRKILIGEEETAEELSSRLSVEGAELLLETINRIKEISPVKQDDREATYAPLLSRKSGEVDWRRNAEEIKNLARAMTPWPGAHTTLEGKNLKILQAKSAVGNGEPGEIVSVGAESLDVAAGKGIVRILSVQIEGSRKMTAAEFLRGRKNIKKGQFLGKA